MCKICFDQMLTWGDEPYFTMGRLQKISKQAKSDTDALTDTAQNRFERILSHCSSILKSSWSHWFTQPRPKFCRRPYSMWLSCLMWQHELRCKQEHELPCKQDSGLPEADWVVGCRSVLCTDYLRSPKVDSELLLPTKFTSFLHYTITYIYIYTFITIYIYKYR